MKLQSYNTVNDIIKRNFGKQMLSDTKTRECRTSEQNKLWNTGVWPKYIRTGTPKNRKQNGRFYDVYWVSKDWITSETQALEN